jgi:hypothetical protein
MREETTSRVMAADRPYGEIYDCYSVSLEYFGYTLVCLWMTKPRAKFSLKVIRHCPSLHQQPLSDMQHVYFIDSYHHYFLSRMPKHKGQQRYRVPGLMYSSARVKLTHSNYAVANILV